MESCSYKPRRIGLLVKNNGDRFWSSTNVQIVKGSGDSLFDNSALAATHRASPLPMPGDSAVAKELRPTFILRFRPK